MIRFFLTSTDLIQLKLNSVPVWVFICKILFIFVYFLILFISIFYPFYSFLFPFCLFTCQRLVSLHVQCSDDNAANKVGDDHPSPLSTAPAPATAPPTHAATAAASIATHTDVTHNNKESPPVCGEISVPLETLSPPTTTSSSSSSSSTSSSSSSRRRVVIVASAPVRVDLAGGWSDTPPISYETEGAVRFCLRLILFVCQFTPLLSSLIFRFAYYYIY